MSPPEFSIICRSHGGPTTSVLWHLANNDVVNVLPDSIEEYTNYEASTVVIDTSHNCIYENKLRVRGNYSGIYTYTLFIHYYSHQTTDLFGMIDVLGKTIISCCPL